MIIHTNQFERWAEYRDLRLRALRDIPQAFLDDPEDAQTWPEEEWKRQLGVVTTQESAMKLYLSLGFVKIGEQKYAVKVGDEYFNEYLMEMYLQ